MNLHDVAVGHLVLGTYLLPIERFAPPDARKLDVVAELLVHLASHVEHGLSVPHGEWPIRIGRLPGRLSVNAHDPERPKQPRADLVELLASFSGDCAPGELGSEKI